MDFYINALFSLTIGIGAIIGWSRYFKTEPAFLPFLLLLSIAFINELISIYLLLNDYSNAMNYNIFQLFESFLITWQFYRWGLFKQKRTLYILLQLVFFVIWFAEEILFSDSYFGSYFIILYSFIIVIMTIHQVNEIVFNDNTPLYKHPVFLICLGYILYFTYAIIVEMFMLFGITQSKLLRINIYKLLTYVNLSTNLLFAYAVLWFPLNRRYIMRF